MNLPDIQIFIKNNITDLFSYIGAIQGFILAIVVLFYPKDHKTSNILLSLFLFYLAYILLAPRIIEVASTPYVLMIYGVRILGPIFLLVYVQSLYRTINWKTQIRHLSIVILDCLVLLSVISVRSSRIEEGMLWGFTGSAVEYFNIAWYISIYTFYLVSVFAAIKKYENKVLQNFSGHHSLGQRWVTQVYVGYVILVVVDLVFGLVGLAFPDFYLPYNGLINTVAYTVFMYFITIKGKLTPQIYQLRKIEVTAVLEAVSIQEVESEHLKRVADQVKYLLEKDKFYKEEGLSIKDIADKIDERPYVVSQAINTCLGKSFFELVNGYRVEEFKNLIMDDNLSHLSLVGIAFEVGFSSKTAFNTAFKKHTGMTPSQFKKEATIALNQEA